MQVDIDIDAVDAYGQQVEAFTRQVGELMGDLQSAISRAESSWQDESIEEAKQQSEAASRNLQSALERLGEEITRLRQQAEWGRVYLSIH